MKGLPRSIQRNERVKAKKAQVFVSSYGDKVFTSLKDLMEYEEKMEKLQEGEANKDRTLPYESDESSES